AEEGLQKFNKGFEDVLKKSQGTYEGFYLKYLNDYLFKPKKAVKKGIAPDMKKAPMPKKKLSSWLWDLLVPSAYACDPPDTIVNECCLLVDPPILECSEWGPLEADLCCPANDPATPIDEHACCVANPCADPTDGLTAEECAVPVVPTPPRLPRGQVMPGKREITVVVNKRAREIPPDIPPGCSEGVRPIPAGLECTLHSDCGEGNFCGIDCECRDIPGDPPDPHMCGAGPLDAGEQCNRDNACALGQICDINCQCVAGPTGPTGPAGPIGPIGPGEPPGGPVASITSNDQCVWRVKGFSSDETRRLYTKLSDDIRAIRKGSNDYFAEREYSSVEAVCCFAGGAAPNVAAGQLSLSLSGSPRPDAEGNMRPFAIIQERGPALEDFTASIWRTTEPHVIDEATLIHPVSTAPSLSAAGGDLLPDLAAPELFRERVVPMTSQYAVNAVTLASRTTVINNVFSHRAQAVGAGQNLSLSSDFSVQLPGAATANQAGIDPQLAQAGAGYACHVVSFKIAPDRANVFGIAGGGEGDKQWYIENRQFDFDALKAELQARCASKELAGQACTDDELKDLPWDAYSTYQFEVVQAKYQSVAALSTSTEEQGSASVTVFTGRPSGVDVGGACKCDLTITTPQPLGLVFLMLFAIIPFAGLVVLRLFNLSFHRNKRCGRETLG
ncbi:MAG: hypothetical protein HY465_05805, partial [Deltaproteobacteria bacterium]|nr:hypothetical protein [Deltaproteobacteria bacterium]